MLFLRLLGCWRGALAAALGISLYTLLVGVKSGYIPANPEEWVERLKPHVVLFSVAAGDREGLPSPDCKGDFVGYKNELNYVGLVNAIPLSCMNDLFSWKTTSIIDIQEPPKYYWYNGSG